MNKTKWIVIGLAVLVGIFVLGAIGIMQKDPQTPFYVGPTGTPPSGDLGACLSDVEVQFKQVWAGACAKKGEGANCELDKDLASLIVEAREADNQSCYREYATW